MTVLVTGAAGFIGMTLSQQLLARGETVIGVDDLNDYYDPALKLARLATLTDKPGFTFQKLDIADTDAVLALNDPALKIDRIVNLAAQAG
ncbi:MAG TPA: protein CapI, partial [Rhodospirillaceae bacterium]|nr:protein CapI [Rhodospirillaceae bacterium]